MATIWQEPRTKHWVARVRRRGQPAASATFETYEEAEAWAAIEEARALGERRGGRAIETARGLTLGQILERYEREITPSKRRPELEIPLIKFWQETPLAARPIRDIDGVSIQAVIDGMRDDRPPRELRTQAEIADWRKRENRRSPNRVRLYLALLSHAYTICRKEWKLGLGNPVSDVRKPSVPKLAPRRPSRSDLRRVFAVCSPKLRQFAEITLETGMRRVEVARLDWTQVKLDERRIELYDGQTKSGRGREVSLSPRAVEVLREKWLADGKPKSGPLWDVEDEHSWTTSWRRACRRAKVDSRRCNLKGLRHERGGSLGAAGWTAVQIAQQLGHEQWTTSRIYTDVRTDEIVDRLSQVPSILSERDDETSENDDSGAGTEQRAGGANPRSGRTAADNDTARKAKTSARPRNDGLGGAQKREDAG